VFAVPSSRPGKPQESDRARPDRAGSTGGPLQRDRWHRGLPTIPAISPARSRPAPTKTHSTKRTPLQCEDARDVRAPATAFKTRPHRHPRRPPTLTALPLSRSRRLRSPRTISPAPIPGRRDALVGSWSARWPPDCSLLYSSSSPRSSRQRRAPSPVQSCADSRWAGRCWPCSRCGSPISHSDGPRLPRCSWDWAAFCCWGSAPRCTRCSTGCGLRRCWGW
jgi:hypothetical protein